MNEGEFNPRTPGPSLAALANTLLPGAYRGVRPNPHLAVRARAHAPQAPTQHCIHRLREAQRESTLAGQWVSAELFFECCPTPRVRGAMSGPGGRGRLLDVHRSCALLRSRQHKVRRMSSMLTHPFAEEPAESSRFIRAYRRSASRYFAVRIALGESDAFRLIAARRYALSWERSSVKAWTA